MQLPQLTTPLRKKTARRVQAARRRIPAAAVGARSAPEPLSAPEPAAPPERRDARRGAGPQDAAFYTCGCGYAFTAAVSTSVGCPHCGAEQAW